MKEFTTPLKLLVALEHFFSQQKQSILSICRQKERSQDSNDISSLKREIKK